MIKVSLCVVCMSQGLYVIRFSLEIRNCRCSFNSEWGRLWAPCVSNIWHAVVSRGATPHCHRSPSHSPRAHANITASVHNTITHQSAFLIHYLTCFDHSVISSILFDYLDFTLSWSFTFIYGPQATWTCASLTHTKLSSQISSSACKVPPTNPERAPALHLSLHLPFFRL